MSLTDTYNAELKKARALQAELKATYKSTALGKLSPELPRHDSLVLSIAGAELIADYSKTAAYLSRSKMSTDMDVDYRLAHVQASFEELIVPTMTLVATPKQYTDGLNVLNASIELAMGHFKDATGFKPTIPRRVLLEHPRYAEMFGEGPAGAR